MKANVLGTEYDIEISNDDKDPYLKHADGYCDNTIQKIVVDEMKPEGDSKANLKAYQNKVMRHELIHAFLFESGLGENSTWAKSEEMVDYFAYQYPKLQKLFAELQICE